MVDLLVKKLEQYGYRRIGVSYKEITLFYTVRNSTCYLVNVIDYREAGTSPVNREFLREFNQSTRGFLANKGLNNIVMLAVVATYSEQIGAELVEGLMPYWVLNTYRGEFVIPPKQPKEFVNVRAALMEVTGNRQSAGITGVRGDGSSSFAMPRSKGSYKNRLINFNNLMVLINVIVFAVLELMGSTENSYFMLEHGAFYWPSVSMDGEIYRFFTCMFLHFGFAHLFSNMIVLYFLGDNLERAIGGKKYLTIYLGSGLIAAFTSCIYYLFVDEQVLSCGASGAIFGVIGALVCIVWRNNGSLEDLSIFRLLLFVGFSFHSGFTSTGVDNAAHVGGFVAGIILASLLYKRKGKNKNVESDRKMY